MVNATKVLSANVQSMHESATLKMAQKARELKAEGIDVISLSLGEPDFDTPQAIKDKATEGLALGMTKYTPVPGILPLRDAICQKLEKENELSYTPDQIIVSTGAKQSLMNIFQSILNPGDEIVVFAPYWVTYVEQVRFCGGVPIIIKAGIAKDYKASARQLEEAISPRTKAVIFSSPCNPSGSVFSKEELIEIAEVVKQYDNILVISDEIYEYINFTSEHVSIARYEGMQERTAIINGFSKGFAMTGWRLGYMAGPEWLVDACKKVQGQTTSGANSFSQYAAAYGILGEKTATFEMVEAFRKRRSLVIELFDKIDGFEVNKPQGAFYLFPNISSFFGKSCDGYNIRNADDMATYLLDVAHVATVSGSAFGVDECIRLSYATSESQLSEAARRIGVAVNKLK